MHPSASQEFRERFYAVENLVSITYQQGGKQEDKGGQGIKLVTEISDRSRLGGNDRVAISLPFME